MNEIVITGATGVIGRRLVRDLAAAGRSVTGVTRSPRGRALLQRLGARAVEVDVFDEAALAAAFAGADAVVNLLTHLPSADRMAAAGAWEENDRLRREASAVIARAARAATAERLIQESVAFVYADGGDAWLDENAPVAAAGSIATALTAEANAAAHFDGDTVVLRFGQFVGPDSGLTLATIDQARAGISPNPGRRDAFLPTVWLDDAAAAVAAVLDAPSGIYNVTDDPPVRRAEIDAALAAAVGRDALRPALDVVPAELEPVARSQRVTSRRLQDAGGWRPSVHGGTHGWRMITERRLAA
jgi:nucleoside-diphosphate-sugar epimerase